MSHVAHVIQNPVTPHKNKKVEAIACELQALQRQRAIAIKSRIMQANRLQAIVAGTLGYSSSMKESERMKKFVEASALIEAVENGEAESPMRSVIMTTLVGVNAFLAMQKELEKQMLAFAKTLPVAKWVDEPNQRGFGLQSLAVVVGECGDLANYANPGKLWRRMGCAPYSHDGKTLMGATWRGGRSGKLPSECWEDFGYSPRRRSIAYVLGEGLVKQNQTGPYRIRYDEAKARLAELHPDYSAKRCHLHGMLLATKLLLRNLWIQWNGGDCVYDTDGQAAAVH